MEKYLNKVIQGDCLSVMKQLPDNCIDLVLTDPPYGIGISGQKKSINKNPKANRKYHEEKNWDSFSPSKEYFDELIRISKNQIIWGGNYFVGKLTESHKGWIFWDKLQHGLTMSDGELAYTSFDSVLRIVGFNRAELLRDGTKHPTQKPLELMVWCLENYLMKKWDKDHRPIVFDGFAGSGTTGVACKKCNCDYILVEKEKDYVDICEKRLAQETLF